jgi:hypothetical protein
MRTRIVSSVFVVVLLLRVADAYSHHSFAAEFDVNKPLTLKGVVTRIDLVNPHSWLYVDVKSPDGKIVNWAVEMGASNALIRRGITRASVPIGVEVTIDGFRAKDGSPTANGVTIRLPDGRQLFAGSTAPGPSAGEPSR